MNTSKVEMLGRTRLYAFILLLIALMMAPLSSASANTVQVNGGVPQTNSNTTTSVTFVVSGNADLGAITNAMKHNTVDAAAGKITTGGDIFSGSGNTVTVDFGELQNGTSSSQRKVLGSFVEELNKSQMTPDSKNNLMDQISGHDSSINKLMIPIIMDATSADLYGATKIANPFLPMVSKFFGVLAIIITILLVGTTLIDLIFIQFPLAREMFNKDGNGGGGGRISWVTTEANSVINDTEGGGGEYRNPFFLYFKRRIVSYIVLAFCLLYLVAGEIGGIIAWLLTLGEGLLG